MFIVLSCPPVVGEAVADEGPWRTKFANGVKNAIENICVQILSLSILGKLCETFAKNELQDLIFNTGFGKGLWDHTILPGGV